MFRWTTLTIATVLALVFPSNAFSHGGGLDANGGHHDRKNGGYHYHRPRRPVSVQPPVRITPPTRTQRSSARRSNSAVASTSSVLTNLTESQPRSLSPASPKGRKWWGRNGKQLAKGQPEDFNLNSCTITINDGVSQDVSIAFENISVLDQAFTLDDFKHSSKYRNHLQRWESKNGVFHVYATPLVIEKNSISLLKTDHRVIEVQLKQLSVSSQKRVLELEKYAIRAKELIAASESNPFEGGKPATSTDVDDVAMSAAE